MPGLFAARCVRQPGKLFGLLGAKTGRELCSVDIDEPRVAVPWCDAFCGQHHRKNLAGGSNSIATQDRVIPGLAWHKRTRTIVALRDDFCAKAANSSQVP